MNPLLLLDIDGVLNPWAARECPTGYVEYRWRRRKAWLRPEHGPVLLELAERVGGELVWATSWAHDANTLVGAALGLPPLRVVEFVGPHDDGGPGWKFPAVARFAYGRPLAWLDDDFELRPDAKERFLARREPPTFLVPVDPAVGLTSDELAAVESFVKQP